jgi:hypothetical protein
MKVLTTPAPACRLNTRRERPTPEFPGKGLELSQGEITRVGDQDLDKSVHRHEGRDWFIQNDRFPVEVSA